MGHVRAIAATMRPLFPSIDYKDLVSCGYVGLCDAAGRYNASRGAFAPYAYQRIRGAIIDAHKRKAYKEELHESLDAMQEGAGPGGADGNNDAYRRKGTSQELTLSKEPAPDVLAAATERRELVEAAIVMLPDDQRLVLSLALKSVQLADIAVACGRSISWVRVRMAAGKKTLTEVMRGKAA
jgi:RNA polymerase sigma factor (sigma-70 family)